MRNHISIILICILSCSASCFAIDEPDSSILYLNTGLVVKLKIAEIHLWGFRDVNGRPVNFKNIDSVKTRNERLVSELRNSYQSIIFHKQKDFYSLDFSGFNPNEFHVKEYNDYLELISSGQKPSISAGKFIGQIMFGTMTGIIAASPFVIIAVSDQNFGEGFFLTLFAVGGYIIGSAWGVYTIGNDNETTGSFSSCLIGSSIAALMFIFPAPIGAAIGYRESREYAPPENFNPALIESGASSIIVNFPAAYVHRNDNNGINYISVKLVQININ